MALDWQVLTIAYLALSLRLAILIGYSDSVEIGSEANLTGLNTAPQSVERDRELPGGVPSRS
jgi:hypothetical protein